MPVEAREMLWNNEEILTQPFYIVQQNIPEMELVPDLKYLLKLLVMDANLQFISEKITDLQNAVMYSMSKSLIKLPNDIVTAVKVDEEGQLWFLSHLPAQSLSACEQSFPARLKFFRKGRNFFVEVSGKATIVSKIPSAANLDNYTGSMTKRKKAVLIKMTMSNIEYVEPRTQTRSKWQELAQKTYSWMLRNIAFHHPETSSFKKLNQPH